MKVDVQLEEEVESFVQSVAELDKLALKYRPVKHHAQGWDMKDVMWMFDNSEEVDADTKLLLQLRSEVTETCKSAEKIGSVLEAVPANEHGQKLRKLCAHELRGDVALTISTMLACDVVLNAKHAGKQKVVCADVFKYMASTLGVTKRDLANVSGKLMAQLQQIEEPQAAKKRSMQLASIDGMRVALAAAEIVRMVT
ncbi:unnamed protein product, partial [Symbiodinium sp. KB8]